MSISHLPQYMLGGFPRRLSCADIVKEIIFHILAIIYAAICTFMYTCAQIFPHFLKNCLMLYDQRERVREREKILRCFGNWESRERTLSRLALKRNRASQWLSEWGREGWRRSECGQYWSEHMQTHMVECYTIALLVMKEEERKWTKESRE